MHFRQFHLLRIANSFAKQTLPLDAFLRGYFRGHRAVGSKDRHWICETLYGMVRWQALLDHLAASSLWEARYHTYLTCNPLLLQQDERIPPHIRVSCPKSLYSLLEAQMGMEQAMQFCLTCNTRAPTTIRVNRLKSTRAALLAAWSDRYDVTAAPISPDAIRFGKGENFFAMPEFKAGLFEIQDEGSQLVADLVEAKPGDLVLDICAGSGGKTLAFAHKLQSKGQIFLYDIRPHALYEAKKRLKRAGVHNAQLLFSTRDELKGKMDWVLVDAPCSGTGTYRRNPDLKWRFEPDALARLVREQRDIFEHALSYLHPHGKIVYATCSVLAQENGEQVEHFVKTFSLQALAPPKQWLPSEGGMDGFFAVTLRMN